MTMRTTIVRLGLAAATLLSGLALPRAALADAWSDANCSGGGTNLTIWKRSQAISYAQPPLKEGYALAGGCYKLNDKDDTPLLAADQGGEGTDCSGFVFRVWALKADGTAGYRSWDYTKDIHGPYLTWDYEAPATGDQFKIISKSLKSTDPMDALVWDRSYEQHIALIWQEGSSSDLFIHAHNNTVGVEISEEIYRQYSDAKAVQRKAWTPECYPKCPGTGVRRP
jgi:hypothetical protein